MLLLVDDDMEGLLTAFLLSIIDGLHTYLLGLHMNQFNYDYILRHYFG